MADRWMDERDRRWRERDWRRSEDPGRGGGEPRRAGEARSFGGSDEGDDYGARRSGPERDRVFGERETGMGYGGEDRSGLRPGAGAAHGAGEGYRAERGYRGGQRGRSDWQDRDYGGVSPAMQQGEYDLERRAERYDQDHGQRGMGGRYYGDGGRERIYRQEYGQGGVEYGEVPRGYDAGRDDGRDRDMDRGERFERGGREAGEFFRRAGERVASWFGGGESERDLRRRDEDRYRDRDFRGMGPKGYKRADERISDEAHERLTDDPWIDATNISVSVSDGEITLSGTVESREGKHRAERCVEDISGVNHVQNNLRVDRGSPLTRPERGYGDSVLEAQMRGQAGSGEDITGGTGPGVGDGSKRGDSSNRTSGSTSPDAGKSR